jgi:hypothetical protein
MKAMMVNHSLGLGVVPSSSSHNYVNNISESIFERP